jgi:site-specific recombinase XerD
MDKPIELTLEQQFTLASFETEVKKMSEQQAKDFLVKLHQQMVIREEYYKHFLRHSWGLEPGPRFK